jgi:superfamily I DNA/RNA helicase
VKSISNEEEIWDLSIPENVQLTLLDILTNPNWTLDNLFDTRQLLYRTTVDQIEGYCEGRIKQLLLNLNEDQESFVHIRANGPVLIKGVAGSGKTTIGLYRTEYLASKIEQSRRMFDNDSSILLLTYTETLTKALHQLYIELYGRLPRSISVRSFKQWMLEQLTKNGIWLTEAGWEIRSKIISQAQYEVAQLHPHDTVVTTRPPTYLLDEIDQVIRARSLASLQEYQTVERVGRGIGLDRVRHRPLVWEIYERYQKALDERSLFDWADLARLTLKNCKPLPEFDVIIVDEAQDLPPSDLSLVTHLLPDHSEHRSLTLLADPAQSIYYRGIAWKEAKINIQGRTRILAKNYRNSKQILEAARHIVDGCEDLKEKDEFILSSSSDRPGPKPIVVSYTSSTKSNIFLAEEIIKLCQAGRYRPGDIAVISRSKNLLTKYIQSFLEQQSILCRFHREEDFHVLENEVKLITMHSAKGLEFPVVFILGLDDKYMPFIDSKSETKREDELQERKLFYVSMTRAAERLYLLHPQRNRCRFLYDLDPTTVREIQC